MMPSPNSAEKGTVSQIHIAHVGHPGRFRWQANFAHQHPPTKLPDTTSQEVCPERGWVNSWICPKYSNHAVIPRDLTFHQAKSQGDLVQKLSWQKKNVGKQPEMVFLVTCEYMWHLLFHPRPSSKNVDFPKGIKPRARTAPPLQALFASVVRCKWVGLIASPFPTRLGFLLGEELAPKIAVVCKMAINCMYIYFERFGGIDCEFLSRTYCSWKLILKVGIIVIQGLLARKLTGFHSILGAEENLRSDMLVRFIPFILPPGTPNFPQKMYVFI